MKEKNEQQRSRLRHLSRIKLDKWTAFDASVDKFVSYRFPRSRFCNKNSSYKHLAQMNFISYSCLSVINFYLINLKEHKNQESEM